MPSRGVKRTLTFINDTLAWVHETLGIRAQSGGRGRGCSPERSGAWYPGKDMDRSGDGYEHLACMVRAARCCGQVAWMGPGGVVPTRAQRCGEKPPRRCGGAVPGQGDRNDAGGVVGRGEIVESRRRGGILSLNFRNFADFPGTVGNLPRPAESTKRYTRCPMCAMPKPLYSERFRNELRFDRETNLREVRICTI